MSIVYITLFLSFCFFSYIIIVYPIYFYKIIDDKCKELNINEYYKKKIRYQLSIFTTFPILKKFEIEEYTYVFYISTILSDLIITNDDNILINNNSFNEYKKYHSNIIEKFENLIFDKNFVYHGFLVENSIYLINCLKEPLDNLKKLLDSSESGLCKETTTKDVLIEVYKVIDSFFDMIEELEYTALNSKTIPTKEEIFNYNTLNKLKEYGNLLDRFKDDIKEHKAIF